MATYTVHKSYIEVLGRIWMPPVLSTYEYTLSEWDFGNLLSLDREGIEMWLALNAGDFSEIIDFHADLYNHFDKTDLVIQWSNPESAYTYHDITYPSED